MKLFECKICKKQYYRRSDRKSNYCSKICFNKSKIDKPAWNKGIDHLSVEAKKRIGEAIKKRFKEKGHPKGMLGKKHTQETKIKQGLWRPNEEQLKKMIHKGEKHPNWKGGITPINLRIRTSKEYKIWRLQIFKRDNFTCIDCGNNKGGNLNADHIKPFALYPESRLDLSNGRTLCIDCHKKTETYGTKTIKIGILLKKPEVVKI
jgi:hypothetical protein